MALFTVSDYLEVQLLSATFGMPFTAPSQWWLHVSTTPVNDDGSGITEFSGGGYGPVQITGWNAATTTPPSGGGATVNSSPTPPFAFPQPSSAWWSDFSQHIYYYLTDAAAPGGNVLGAADGGLPHGPKPDHPLVVTQININVTGNVGGTAGSFPASMLAGALNSVTGAAAYSVPALNVGLGVTPIFGAGKEIWDTVFTGINDFGDPNYVRRNLSSWLTTPTTVAGVTSCSNANDITWTVTADIPGTYTHGVHWTGAEYTAIWDAAGTPGGPYGTLLFLMSGSYPAPAGGDTVKIPAGALVFKVD